MPILALVSIVGGEERNWISILGVMDEKFHINLLTVPYKQKRLITLKSKNRHFSSIKLVFQHKAHTLFFPVKVYMNTEKRTYALNFFNSFYIWNILFGSRAHASRCKFNFQVYPAHDHVSREMQIWLKNLQTWWFHRKFCLVIGQQTEAVLSSLMYNTQEQFELEF
jgi:hypothetical protein